MVLRLEGTNKEEAENILSQSSLPVIFAQNMSEAIDTLLKQMEIND